jgi:hypothetical protein
MALAKQHSPYDQQVVALHVYNDMGAREISALFSGRPCMCARAWTLQRGQPDRSPGRRKPRAEEARKQRAETGISSETCHKGN